MGEPSFELPTAEKAQERRLDSWKEIAAYLSRDVTTVQRWEKREGMPVHRHLHEKRGSVYALPAELDSWMDSRVARAQKPETGEPAEALRIASTTRSGTRRLLWLSMASLVLLAGLAGSWLAWRSPARTVAPSGIHSLAVLPLRNLSGDPSQEFLTEGMTEALIGRLSQIHNLRVISHTSVMRFRNPQTSIPQIARALGVDALVEGSVLREGSRIRVTAQLIRGATDEHFWSATYDRELRDALTLESDLAESIAEKVEVTITGQEHQRFAAARPVAPEVYESYLKGRYALNHGNSRAQLQQSIGDLQDAIHRDASFAPAYLGLAEAYTRLGTIFAGDPPPGTRPQVIAFARKALALDPDLARAHVVLANVLQEEWQWTEAESEYKLALQLDPNDALAHAGFALWLLCQGRTDEAVARLRLARQLDPVAVTGSDLSDFLFQARRFDEAIREARSALALEPDDAYTLMSLGFALIAARQAPSAIPVLEKAVALSQGSPAATAILIRAYARAGRRRDAQRLLVRLQERRKSGYVPAGAFVNAWLGLGDNEQAFYWLDKACAEKSNILQFLRTHPYFDPLRGDPRFSALLRRVGLD